MSRFLAGEGKHPPLTQYETEHSNSFVTVRETRYVFLNFSEKTSLSQDGFPGELYQTFKEELAPCMHNLFQKTEENGTFSNSFYDLS